MKGSAKGRDSGWGTGTRHSLGTHGYFKGGEGWGLVSRRGSCMSAHRTHGKCSSPGLGRKPTPCRGSLRSWRSGTHGGDRHPSATRHCQAPPLGLPEVVPLQPTGMVATPAPLSLHSPAARSSSSRNAGARCNGCMAAAAVLPRRLFTGSGAAPPPAGLCPSPPRPPAARPRTASRRPAPPPPAAAARRSRGGGSDGLGGGVS